MKGPELSPAVQAAHKAAAEAARRGDTVSELAHFLQGQLLMARLGKQKLDYQTVHAIAISLMACFAIRPLDDTERICVHPARGELT